MLGFSLRSDKRTRVGETKELDVAKLFFDAFSSRLTGVEEELRSLSLDMDGLKLSRNRSQISDLVLLERLQKAELILEESLRWVKYVAEAASSQVQRVRDAPRAPLRAQYEEVESGIMAPGPTGLVIAPTGEAGSLPSITTPTELQVLSLLANRGPLSAPEVGKAIGRSREHSARLMKKLFEDGYVRRDQSRIPFRYSLVDRVRQSFRKAESKPGEQETVTVPQA